MDETLDITYSYTFQDREKIDFPLVLKKETLSLLNTPAGEPPFWAELEFNRCSVCSLANQSKFLFPLRKNIGNI